MLNQYKLRTFDYSDHFSDGSFPTWVGSLLTHSLQLCRQIVLWLRSYSLRGAVQARGMRISLDLTPFSDIDPIYRTDFYEDAEELAREIAQPLPEVLAAQNQPDIDPDEFEQVYTWFLS